MIRFTTYEGFADLGTTNTDQDTIQDTIQDKMLSLLEFCMVPRARNEIQIFTGLKNRSHFVREYLTPLLDESLLEMTLPNKPTSRNQRYVTTQKGRDLLGK